MFVVLSVCLLVSLFCFVTIADVWPKVFGRCFIGFLPAPGVDGKINRILIGPRNLINHSFDLFSKM